MFPALFLSAALAGAVAAGGFEKCDRGELPLYVPTHPSPSVPAPTGSGRTTFDLHGNHWALVSGDPASPASLHVLPAQAPDAWRADELSHLPLGNWQWLESDRFGILWIADHQRLLHMDPRKPTAGWTELVRESITAMALAPSGGILIATEDDRIIEVLPTLTRHAATRWRLTSTSAPADIRRLAPDACGSIWARTPEGIFRKPPAPDAWQNHWEQVATMPGGSHDLGGHVLDGVFYMDWAITGEFGYPSSGTVHRKLLAFDPKSGRWTVATDYGLPRGYCAVGALDDKIWTVAGTTSDEAGKHEAIARSQIYDPVSAKLTDGPDLPVALPLALGLSSGGRFYVIGHTDGKAAPLTLHSIGTGESAWRAEPSGPIGHGAAYGTELDGKLYVLAGQGAFAVFDTGTLTWQVVETPHTPRAPAVGHHQGEIWIMGGRNKEREDITYIYTPATGQWRQGPDLPRKLAWGAAFTIDGQLYLTGGFCYEGFSNATFRAR